MKKLIFILLILLSCSVFSQELTLKDLEGIWRGYFEVDHKYLSYKLIKNSLSINVGYSIYDGERSETSFQINTVGFVSYEDAKAYIYGGDGRRRGELLPKKSTYSVYDEYKRDYIIFGDFIYFCEEIYEDGMSLLYDNGNMFYYGRDEELPQEFYNFLYSKGAEDRRDYLKEFLSQDISYVKVEKAVFYSEPDSVSNMHLSKDDMVEILEQKDNWVKVKFIVSDKKEDARWLSSKLEKWFLRVWYFYPNKGNKSVPAWEINQLNVRYLETQGKWNKVQYLDKDEINWVLGSDYKKLGIIGWLPIESIYFNPHVMVEKARIYSSPNEITKMYLIKDDKMELLEIKEDWLKMRYITAKGREIIGWLKRDEVSLMR